MSSHLCEVHGAGAPAWQRDRLVRTREKRSRGVQYHDGTCGHEVRQVGDLSSHHLVVIGRDDQVGLRSVGELRVASAVVEHLEVCESTGVTQGGLHIVLHE